MGFLLVRRQFFVYGNEGGDAVGTKDIAGGLWSSCSWLSATAAYCEVMECVWLGGSWGGRRQQFNGFEKEISQRQREIPILIKYKMKVQKRR